jgi:hypothetical protein
MFAEASLSWFIFPNGCSYEVFSENGKKILMTRISIAAAKNVMHVEEK